MCTVTLQYDQEILEDHELTQVFMEQTKRSISDIIARYV